MRVSCWISVPTPCVPPSPWAEGFLPFAGWPWEHGSARWGSCWVSHSLWEASLFTSGPLVLLRGRVVTASSWGRMALALICPVLLLNPIKELNKENHPVKPGLRWARWRRCPVQRGGGRGRLSTCLSNTCRPCGMDSGAWRGHSGLQTGLWASPAPQSNSIFKMFPRGQRFGLSIFLLRI